MRVGALLVHGCTSASPPSEASILGACGRDEVGTVSLGALRPRNLLGRRIAETSADVGVEVRRDRDLGVSRRSETTVISTLASSARLALVCRRSCSRMAGRPDCWASAWKWRVAYSGRNARAVLAGEHQAGVVPRRAPGGAFDVLHLLPGKHLATQDIRGQLVARGIQPNSARKAAMFQLAGEPPPNPRRDPRPVSTHCLPLGGPGRTRLEPVHRDTTSRSPGVPAPLNRRSDHDLKPLGAHRHSTGGSYCRSAARLGFPPFDTPCSTTECRISMRLILPDSPLFANWRPPLTSPDLDPYRQRAGVRGRRQILILVALMPVMIVLGIVVAKITTPGPFSLRAMVMVGGISVAILLLTIFGVMGITRWRTGRWSVEQPALVGASRRTRRQVLRNVRRGSLPGNEPDRSLAVDLARTQLRHRWAVWIPACTAALELVNAVFLQERTITRLSMGLAGCIFIALTVLIVVQRRGASALLARF